jgi:hypothetical protein
MLRAMVHGALVLGCWSLQAAAEPLDLLDPTPRPVYVVFEVSPVDRPDQLDARYGEPFVAWLEPAKQRERVRVTLDASSVERMMEAHQPKRGTFSDFVWVFDPASGHVLSASLTGTLMTHLDWGLFTTRVETDIEVLMSTQQVGGFLRPRERLGQMIFAYCAGDEPDCTSVRPRPYEPSSGYVNAVGEIVARSVVGGIVARTFSPLGEAIFSELGFPN